VTAEQLTIHPHPNADALELAQVGLYRTVVPKGVYETGEWAIYIPDQAILPDALIEELGLGGRLAGKAGNRVKAVRLRGELSQGIVCRPAATASVLNTPAAREGMDFAELLGITKWVPEVPGDLAGEMISAPDILPMIEIENIKRYPDVFAPGEMVTATEKIHGSACCVTVTRHGDMFVSSKGFSQRRLAIVESDKNLYWRAVRAYDVENVARGILEELGADRVGIFGEVYGVQDLKYGTTKGTPGYAVFDIQVDVDGEVFWVDQNQIVDLLAGGFPNTLPMVPPIFTGPYNEALLLEMAKGREQITGTEAHIREGIVVRPYHERDSDVLDGSRAILKIVSDDYLIRKGNVTEYE
jgi:RNA ligase (TIGR02306 family)